MLFTFVELKKKVLDMCLSDIENSDLPSESKLMTIFDVYYISSDARYSISY